MKSVASLILLVVCLALAMIGSVNAACLRGTSEGGDARSLRGANEAGKDSGSLRKLFTVGGATDCWGKDTYCLCGTSCGHCCNGYGWYWSIFGCSCN